jgi:archaellum component FlaC
MKITLKNISEQIQELSKRIYAIDQKIELFHAEASEQIRDVLDLVDKRFLIIEGKVDHLIENTSNHETRISTLETDHSALKTRVEKISRSR